MGLDLAVGDGGDYCRGYGTYHGIKDMILEYYGITDSIDYCYRNETKEYPEINFDILDKLYGTPNNKEDLQTYKDFLNLLDKEGIKSLAIMVCYSDCDGKIRWQDCANMNHMIEAVIPKKEKINGTVDPDLDWTLSALQALLNDFKLAVEMEEDVIFC